MIARDPTDRVDKTAHFVELTATTLAVLGPAWYQANAIGSVALATWERKLEPFGITLGAWIAVAESAQTELRKTPNDPVARTIRLT
jgi:hypothetical protein